MIDPVLPAGVIQALTAKAERPPIAVSVLSAPKVLAAAAQPREIGGTVTQASVDGKAVLQTAVGDITIKAPVVLAPGRTATLLLTPTTAGLTAALQVNGAAPLPSIAQGQETVPGSTPTAAPAAPGLGTGQASPAPARPGLNLQPSSDRRSADPASVPPMPARNTPGAQPVQPRPIPLPAGEHTPKNTAPPLPGLAATPAAPAALQGNPGLRDAALLLSQLAAQLIEAPLPQAPVAASLADTVDRSPAAAQPAALAAVPMTISSGDGRPLPADPASLLIGLTAALKRHQPRREDELPDRVLNEGDSAIAGESISRSPAKQPEDSETISWRQFQVMDDSRVVPVFLGRQAPDEDNEPHQEQAGSAEQPARFTVRFDLDHAGPVRIDSVYRDRRLDMLLTLDAAPDQELQTAVRQRLAALSDEFGLSISLRIGGADPAAR